MMMMGEDEEDEVEMDFTGGKKRVDDDDDDDADDGWRLEVILDGHDSEIKGVAFCPTAPLLATCSRDKSVWVWEELDEENFETVAVLQDHEGDVKCVAWHPEELLLASGSYDDRVRLWREDVDDWACCALLEGHRGTVWWLEFEAKERVGVVGDGDGGGGEGEEAGWRDAWVRERVLAGPRLMSCSDDQTIRVWTRVPKQKDATTNAPSSRMPSIWKNSDFEERWVEEAVLPRVHDRPVYSISWSQKTGRVVSAGSDGLIVVYEEQWRRDPSGDSDMVDDDDDDATPRPHTEWVVVAQIENAHDVFEVNHVVWAPRFDRARRSGDEEIVVSTGDDGEVKAWMLED
jgi:WD40 repeat protein